LYFAAKGIDTIVYMAEGNVDRPETLFSASVHGFYNALMVARAGNVRWVILLSSLSVHSPHSGSITGVADLGEDVPPQCDHPDGITVLIGEWLGRYFAETFGMSVFALRISGPTPDNVAGFERTRLIAMGDTLWSMTAASDITDAILRTANIEDHIGFEVINICGDFTGERVDISKAERILGWRPTI
jgi:nucleoside-diphosphate-sugar epimerase